jgi:hypothetical protein
MATFAQRLVSAKNIIAGLAAHVETLSKRGFTQEVIDQMSGLYDQAVKQDDARNALKARSQEATTQAEETMTELESFCGDAKKIIRMDLPEETWPEFGFRKGEYAGKGTTTVVSSKVVSPAIPVKSEAV